MDDADIFSLAAPSDDELEEYQNGYDDGFNGRSMKRNTTPYTEGYTDGVDDREDTGTYRRFDDDDIWS